MVFLQASASVRIAKTLTIWDSHILVRLISVVYKVI